MRRKDRRKNEGFNWHELDEDVERRSGCVLERIADDAGLVRSEPLGQRDLACSDAPA